MLSSPLRLVPTPGRRSLVPCDWFQEFEANLLTCSSIPRGQRTRPAAGRWRGPTRGWSRRRRRCTYAGGAGPRPPRARCRCATLARWRTCAWGCPASRRCRSPCPPPAGGRPGTPQPP
eukprot:342881-Prorocentrum_minimum.AAC.1